MPHSIAEGEREYSSERSAFIASVYERMAADLTCLFKRWPKRTVSKITIGELLRHVNHSVSITVEQDKTISALRCQECRTTIIL